MLIKTFEDSHLLDLVKLFYTYNQVMKLGYTSKTSTEVLLYELNKPNSICTVLENSKGVQGFILGFPVNGIVNIHAIYIEEKYRFYAKKLYQFTEDLMKEQGHKGWVSFGRSPEGSNFLRKVGAVPIEIKYYKEL